MPSSLASWPEDLRWPATFATWRSFMASAATIGTGSVPVARAWRSVLSAVSARPDSAASATLNPVASTRPP